MLAIKMLQECRCCADVVRVKAKLRQQRVFFLLYDFSFFYYDSFGIYTESQWYNYDMSL